MTFSSMSLQSLQCKSRQWLQKIKTDKVLFLFSSTHNSLIKSQTTNLIWRDSIEILGNNVTDFSWEVWMAAIQVKFFRWALNSNEVPIVDDGSFPAAMRNFLFSVGAQDIFVQLPEIQFLLLDGFLKCNTVKALMKDHSVDTPPLFQDYFFFLKLFHLCAHKKNHPSSPWWLPKALVILQSNKIHPKIT